MARSTISAGAVTCLEPQGHCSRSPQGYYARLLLSALHNESTPIFWTLLTTKYWSTGWPKKRGHHLIANILKFHDRITWKLVNSCNIIMLNTVINFLFKNFIELWRHLAKTQLLSFIRIVQIDLSITQYSCFFARWRHSAMKFLNKKLMTVFSI